LAYLQNKTDVFLRFANDLKAKVEKLLQIQT